MNILIGIITELWNILLDSSIYVLFGLFIAGIIQTFIDKDRIALHLGRKSFKSVFLAALFGIPLPLCSCGVLPTAMSLKKTGASKGAVLSFLISTPETGVDSIAVSYALLDPLMTVFRPFAAFVTALVAGITENIFGSKESGSEISENRCVFCDHEEGDHNHSLRSKFKYGMKYAFVDLFADMAFWFLIGVVAAAIIAYCVPFNFFEQYLGTGIKPILVMLIVGIPMYICASASTPIAAAFLLKGMSPGAAFVFLLAGPATNIAGIFTVGKFLGRRSIVIYLSAIAFCSILFGIILDFIYRSLNINIQASIGTAGELIPYPVRLVAVIIFLGMILYSQIHGYVNKCKRM
ncbi:MAG: SO_0444 family Cu/Zn efflux transporter [Candidatus Omnitrophica bacterium]|nr:SO_0444 family Cu/Zn efflux transporter [Candidatus Omnitrophota bacterium]